jgi:glycosyltransferase involved in cell wall biosynthesis
MKWICCQLGAREHFAVPRAVDGHGALEYLLTDTWVRPGHLLGKMTHSLRERYHKDLAGANVLASNLRTVGFELGSKVSARRDWTLMISRNAWFQRMVVSRLAALNVDRKAYTVFAFSYAARKIFLLARERGWRTVLGQIDAGPPEERLVARLHAEDAAAVGRWNAPPPQYWADWREECSLADRIVVNSSWSQTALQEEGVPASKIRVVPLAYEAPVDTTKFKRQYPRAFTISRPLRALFLGTVCLRKGVRPLFEAIRLLRGDAVEFWFVGRMQVPAPADLQSDPKVRWFGAVSRSETARFYRESDVFLFPTFSDGFGLTQLEAQAWRLPIIATRFCGDVVEHGYNGWLLPEPSGAAIAAAIRCCLAEPERLRQFATNAGLRAQFGLRAVGERLLHIFDEWEFGAHLDKS